MSKQFYLIKLMNETPEKWDEYLVLAASSSYVKFYFKKSYSICVEQNCVFVRFTKRLCVIGTFSKRGMSVSWVEPFGYGN